jgi:hypothetical protein
MQSKVSTPPILIIGEFSLGKALKFGKSAPIKVPRVPETHAITCVYLLPMRSNKIAEELQLAGRKGWDREFPFLR